MKKSTKILYSLLLIVILVLTYVLVVFINSHKDQGESKPQVTDINMNKIIKVELFNEGKTITLIKEGKEWQTDLGYKIDLSELAVFNILMSLSSLKAERIITENPTDLSIFGLDNPGIKATMTLKNGKTKSLLVGNKTPSGEYFYLKKDEADTIYTVNSFFGNSFNLKMNDLRNRILPEMALKTLRYFRLRTDKTIEIVELDSNDVILTSSPSILKFKHPYTNKLLDIYKFSKMVETLPPLFFITHFIEDRPANLSNYGLRYPKAEITLKDEEGRGLDMLIGDKSGEEGLYYAKLRNKPEVFTIDLSETDFIDVKPFDLVSKFILLININYIENFRIKGNGVNLTAYIERENNGKDVRYKINDQYVEENKFKNLYQRMIGLTADAENPQRRIGGSSDVTIGFVLNLPGRKYLTLDFKEYNQDFYRAVSFGTSDFLISKDQVNQLLEIAKEF